LHFGNGRVHLGQGSEAGSRRGGQRSHERSSIHKRLLKKGQAVFTTMSMNCVHGALARVSDLYAASSASSCRPIPAKPGKNVLSLLNFEICGFFHDSGWRM